MDQKMDSGGDYSGFFDKLEKKVEKSRVLIKFHSKEEDTQMTSADGDREGEEEQFIVVKDEDPTVTGDEFFDSLFPPSGDHVYVSHVDVLALANGRADVGVITSGDTMRERLINLVGILFSHGGDGNSSGQLVSIPIPKSAERGMLESVKLYQEKLKRESTFHVVNKLSVEEIDSDLKASFYDKNPDNPCEKVLKVELKSPSLLYDPNFPLYDICASIIFDTLLVSSQVIKDDRTERFGREITNCHPLTKLLVLERTVYEMLRSVGVEYNGGGGDDFETSMPPEGHPHHSLLRIFFYIKRIAYKMFFIQFNSVLRNSNSEGKGVIFDEMNGIKMMVVYERDGRAALIRTLPKREELFTLHIPTIDKLRDLSKEYESQTSQSSPIKFVKHIDKLRTIVEKDINVRKLNTFKLKTVEYDKFFKNRDDMKYIQSRHEENKAILDELSKVIVIKEVE